MHKPCPEHDLQLVFHLGRQGAPVGLVFLVFVFDDIQQQADQLREEEYDKPNYEHYDEEDTD